MKNKYIFFGIRVSSVVFVGAGDGTPGGTQYRVPPLMLRTSPGSGLRNNCLNPHGHGIYQSCTGCCWHPLPLLHNDITELLDVRHMVLLHLPLEDAPHVLNRVQVWRHTWPLHHLHLQQQGSCHLGGVFGVVVMLENSF